MAPIEPEAHAIQSNICKSTVAVAVTPNKLTPHKMWTPVSGNKARREDRLEEFGSPPSKRLLRPLPDKPGMKTFTALPPPVISTDDESQLNLERLSLWTAASGSCAQRKDIFVDPERKLKFAFFSTCKNNGKGAVEEPV